MRWCLVIWVRRGSTLVPTLPMTNADDVSANANFGFNIVSFNKRVVQCNS